MRFALMCFDKPDHLEIRKANRDAHLGYIGETGVVEMAGPLLDGQGDMCGSLIVLAVDSLEDARNWAQNDPYAKAGLFEMTRLQEWNKVLG